MIEIPMELILGVIMIDKLSFKLYTYPRKNFQTKRKEIFYKLQFANEKECEEWMKAIENCSKEGDCEKEARQPKVLFFVNPFSGTKKAMGIFEKIVKPMLEIAKIRYEKLETQYAGHAAKHVSTMDLKEYDALVTISGDGLFYEMLNGLLSREDWKEAIKTPISTIPGGSGNALSTAMVGVLDPLTSTFNVIKGMAKPFDIGSVLQKNKRTFFFLAFSWGIIADVDFDSETLRWMGSARFTVTPFLFLFIKFLKNEKMKGDCFEKDYCLEKIQRKT
jgi:hypothetical protein